LNERIAASPHLSRSLDHAASRRAAPIRVLGAMATRCPSLDVLKPGELKLVEALKAAVADTVQARARLAGVGGGSRARGGRPRRLAAAHLGAAWGGSGARTTWEEGGGKQQEARRAIQSAPPRAAAPPGCAGRAGGGVPAKLRTRAAPRRAAETGRRPLPPLADTAAAAAAAAARPKPKSAEARAPALVLQ